MLIAVVCLALFGTLPMCRFMTGDTTLTAHAYGSYLSVSGASAAFMGVTSLAVCLALLTGIATLLMLVNVFLFKHRTAQLSVLFAEYVLELGIIGFAVAEILIVRKGVYAAGLGDVMFAPSWTLALPVVALVMNYLAVRGVAHDEALVRSVNRIR